MSKIDFNSENYSHRLLLAQAMRDYAREPGRTLSGTRESGEASLLSALADSGIAMSKSNLDRIAAAGHPDDRERPYGNNARRVAQFLEEKGYFPPGQKPEDAFKLLPAFFGGISESGAGLLRELEGVFTSYQFDEFNNELVADGFVIIRPITPWYFAPFSEVIGSGHLKEDTMSCSGIAFVDEQKTLYLIGRERVRSYPRFYMFEGIDRPDGKSLGVIRGTLLGGSSNSRRHLSPIALVRNESKVNRTGRVFPLSDKDLPEYVAHYLSMTMKPGPKNTPSELTRAEIDERRSRDQSV